MENTSQPKTVKTKVQVYLEYFLLAVCLCTIALRATFAEGPTVQLANQQINPLDTVYSLAVSVILIICFLLWLIVGFYTGRFKYRPTGIEIGLTLFAIAAIISSFFASNKRAAISDFTTLLAGLLMIILLVQILDTTRKIKLVLVVIASLGLLSTYQCNEQFLFNNKMDIEQYEQNPENILRSLGIKAGSFQQMMFEHRLYSKDVNGFFTTSNSAGSFAMMAFFAAVAVLWERFKNLSQKTYSYIYFLIAAALALLVLIGLILTQSKGAITALLIAVFMFVTYLAFGNRLKKYKKSILIIVLLVLPILAAAIICYGAKHHRLPGGNSMLVRWQYWQASAKMYLDHWPTGVGPGNFPNFYPYYKPAAALETVSEPHNFLMNILTQYGPFGLAGFLAVFLTALYKTIFPKNQTALQQSEIRQPSFVKLSFIYLIAISAVLSCIRPIIIPLPAIGSSLEKRAAELILYIIPVLLFAFAFCLFSISCANIRLNTNTTAAILFCAVVGLLIHNLIDFAIFEPGIFTTFCAILACLISLNLNKKQLSGPMLKPKIAGKIMMTIVSIAIAYTCLNIAFIPVAKACWKINDLAFVNRSYAHKLLDQAAEDDPLSTTALTINAQLYLDEYNFAPKPNPQLLIKSTDCLEKAIERNKAYFKNYRKLSSVQILLAKNHTLEKQDDWAQKAFEITLLALERYPGSGQLRLQSAKLAEMLNKKDFAVTQYKKAVEIEDSYRKQFQVMYPGKAVFSRLGNENYKLALERIEELTGKAAR
ncbi:MAG: O-antigen ligase family protein [Planctomycetota bacterium]|jgi:O-antigen ligase